MRRSGQHPLFEPRAARTCEVIHSLVRAHTHQTGLHRDGHVTLSRTSTRQITVFHTPPPPKKKGQEVPRDVWSVPCLFPHRFRDRLNKNEPQVVTQEYAWMMEDRWPMNGEARVASCGARGAAGPRISFALRCGGRQPRAWPLAGQWARRLRDEHWKNGGSPMRHQLVFSSQTNRLHLLRV